MSPTNLSRRAILAGAASVPALALPAVAATVSASNAIGPSAGPDAELFKLIEQIRRRVQRTRPLANGSGAVREKAVCVAQSGREGTPGCFVRHPCGSQSWPAQAIF